MANPAPLIKYSAAAARALRAAYRRDRDHLVALDEDYFVGTFRETFRWRGRDLPILPYAGDWFEIRDDRQLWLFRDGPDGPRSDGATYAPDKIAGVDIAPGFLPHDRLYDEIEKMAADPKWQAAGWTFDALRALFDIVLGRQIHHAERKAHRIPWRSRLYHAAVRLFGGVFHRLAREKLLLVAAIAALALAGCGGCAVPDGVFDPSGLEPVYHVIPR